MQKKTIAFVSLFLLTFGIRLTEAFLFPVTTDEAYYFYWANFLDLGYLDHPPIIAWLGSLGQIWPSEVGAFRLLGCLLTALMFPFTLSLAKMIGLSQKRSLLLTIILSHFNLAGLILGFIQTPDLPLAVFWLIALHEAAAALSKDPKRWISAGLITGLGLTSKYIMVLIGPVFLISLLSKPRLLRTKWPYLGAISCLIAFGPHLYWNSQHNWASFAFQIGRGFKGEHSNVDKSGSKLPKAQQAQKGSQELLLSQKILEKENNPPKKKKEKKPHFLPKPIRRLGDFLAGQIGLWGALCLPIGFALFRQNRQAIKVTRETEVLMKASVYVPIIFFGFICLFQKVEANWSAPYLIGASFMIASRARSIKPFAIAALINTVLIFILTYHARSPLRENKDRVLSETRGYKKLSLYLDQLSGPIFADTYQNTSMINFYQPHLRVTQWPGISRPSEATRRSEMQHTKLKDITARGNIFYLVTNNLTPPHLPGFSITSLTGLHSCVDDSLIIINTEPENQIEKCRKSIHRWYLASYKAITSSEADFSQ